MTSKPCGLARVWGPLAASLSLAALVTLLPGCGSNPPVNASAPPPPPAANRPTNDVRTESDTTDAERRARVRMELAGAYFGRGQWTTALDEVKLALQAKPDLSEAYNLRGLIYAAMGEPALGEESFRHSLQLNPRDADTMHNYGSYLCQQRRYGDAVVQFSAAIAVPTYRDPHRTYLTLGVCQARNNQWPEAEKSLLRSFELDPGNPTTAVNLSEVLLRRGELERARFYIRRVNAVDELVNAQSLWLAARIENKLGQKSQVDLLGNQLRNRFPQSPEADLYEKGRFDE